MENTLRVLVADSDNCRKQPRIDPEISRFDSHPKTARFYAIFEKKARVHQALVHQALVHQALVNRQLPSNLN
jgi:hypothetical protein